MENEKILIIGPTTVNKYKIQLANYLLMKNSDLSLINTFCTDESLNQNHNSSQSGYYYMPYLKVKESFKNSSVVYCTIDENNNDITKGIMTDDWYNGDIAVLDFIDFNNISNKIFTDYTDSIFIVWLDTTMKSSALYNNLYDKETDIRESNYSVQKIESNNINVLYFNINNESLNNITDTVLQYYSASDIETRNQLLFENS